MALRGNLRDCSALQLLNLIKVGRKTGTLSVDEREVQARLYFAEGKLLYGELTSQDCRLIELLRRSGRLTGRQSQAVLAQAGSRTDRQLGWLLVNGGLVTKLEIIQAVRAQVAECAYRVMTWPEGGFVFEPNAAPFSDRVLVPIDLEGLIIQGSRRLKEWRRLQEELPQPELALRFTGPPGARTRETHLTAEEWRVVSLVDGNSTIHQIAQQSNIAELQARRIAFRLQQAGLVEVVQPRETAPASTGARGDPSARKRPEVTPRNIILRLIDRIRKL